MMKKPRKNTKRGRVGGNPFTGYQLCQRSELIFLLDS